MKRHLPPVLLLVSVSLILMTAPVTAQQPTPSDDQVNELARQMYCPVCENTPLDVCPTKACAQWRELIRQKISEGWTDQQIKDYFAKQYGDRVLAEPPGLTATPLIFTLPTIIVLAAALILYRVRTSVKTKDSLLMDTPVSVSEEEVTISRVEEELQRFRKG